MASEPNPLLGLATNALERYGFAKATIRTIRHNENAAFEVHDESSGRRYLLRVHRPSSANLLGIQHTFEGLCAEMRILRAFRVGTGLPLQQPVANHAGLFVTGAADPQGGTLAPCTLLTWVDGDALDGKDPRLPEIVPRMGHTVARMHRFSRSWQPDGPLPRPVYDAAKYRFLVDQMAVGVTQELFTAEHYDTVLETMQQIEALFASIPRTRQTWGIIHADLGPGNWVLAPGADGRDGTAVRQPVPIDWCFCGYGPYLFDVGGTVPGLRPELRRLYLDGYQQEAGPLTAAELRFCDACFVLSVLGAAGFHISNPASHEWIARRMPWWAGRYCRSFLAGESPLDADE